MNAFIYIEGGASGPHSKSLTIRCQMAFHKLLCGTGFEGKMPRLKPCGGRDAVYKDFCTAQKAGQAGYVAMWIVADRAALREHYKQNLNENPLPHTSGLESRQRHEVQQALETATKNCNNAYAKGKRSFEIFEKLDPEVLRQHLPSFERVARILNAKL